MAIKARCRAAVPLLQEATYFTFKNFEILFSNFFTYFPVVIKSSFKALETSLMSWLSIY